MKRLILSLGLVSSVAFAKDAAYTDNKKTVTHDCGKDPVALITGNENTITFTGACKDIAVMGNKNTAVIAAVSGLSVSGNQNTITVDAVAKLGVTGNKNTVTWKKASSGDAPDIRDSGKDNRITRSK